MHGERSRKKKSNKELPNLFLFASVIRNSYFEWIRKILEQTRKLRTRLITKAGHDVILLLVLLITR